MPKSDSESKEKDAPIKELVEESHDESDMASSSLPTSTRSSLEYNNYKLANLGELK